MGHQHSSAGLASFVNHTTHWRLTGSTYFTTWSLLPSQPELADAERALVAQTLEHFHGQRYRLYAYVVMNDHVHVIFTPAESQEMSEIVRGWKSFTANRLQRLHARQGGIWQKDYHDRIVRDEADLLHKMQYVLDNPRKRWPEVRDYQYVRWYPL